MDHKKLMRLLREQGFTCRTTGSGHVAIYKDNQWVTTMGSTPNGGKRSGKNALAWLRKAGLEVPR